MHETTLSAYVHAQDTGRDQGLKEAFLRVFMAKPCTTWEAACKVHPQNPDLVYKDGTAAVNWLRRARLVLPTGEVRTPPGRRTPSEVLTTTEDAEPWLDGDYEPRAIPSEKAVLRDVATAAMRLTAENRNGGATVASQNLLDSAVQRLLAYYPPASAESVRVEQAQKAVEREERLARAITPDIVQAAKDGVWIRRTGKALPIPLMGDHHLRGAIRRLRAQGVQDDAYPLLALVREAGRRPGTDWFLTPERQAP